MGAIDELAGNSPLWFRYLIIAAIGSGAVSSGISLNADTSDRYKRAEAVKDLAVRDKKDEELAGEIRRLEIAMNNHLQHSAEYSRIILDLKERVENTPHPPARVELILADHEQRIRSVEHGGG